MHILELIIHTCDQKKQEPSALKIQSTWRMFRHRCVYLRWKRTRTRHRREIFQAWHFSHRVHKKSQSTIIRKYFLAWKGEVEIALRLREIELKLFRQAEMQSGLPKLVMNLVFTSTDHDIPVKEPASNTTAAATTTKQAPAAPARSSFAFFMQTYAGADQLSSMIGAKDNRIQQMRLEHTEARRAVSKKIVQQFFLLWKQVHQADQRIGLNAQLCIKRAARLAFGSRRPVWSAEKLMTIFDMWARWASFHRCKRQGIPVTRYAQSNPQWDIWLHQYQERKIRQLKATAKSPLARMRRYFCRLHAFSSHVIAKKRAMELAIQHYNDHLSHLVLVLWREEIAESAALKKLCRNTFCHWRDYVQVKLKLRPRKNAVIAKRKLWDYGHAWQAWTGVHLRSCFKRELHLTRMEHWRWRSKVHRILFIWMDVKSEVNKWKTFEAWRNFVQRRKLYLMLRFHCDRIQKRNLLYGILNAWKSVVWKHDEGFLEDRLKLNAWAAYEEIAPTMSMLFFGYYGNAAAIFGGVPVPKTGDSDPFVASRIQNEADEQLPYTTNGIRRFQTMLLQGSLADVRNSVLQSKHLINAVDEDSGNTPLHIVMQIEDPDHRIAELEFLLSEGAATWDRPNRHGLTPKQLAPDAASKRLLEKGVYEFHAANIMRSPGSTIGEYQDFRLAWCITTLMSSEWVRGERLAGNIKVREWHSVMKEALWLRQERMFFASASEFSPAILRCRAFLNGMRHKIYRSPYDWVDQRLKKDMQLARRMTTRRSIHQHSSRLSISSELIAKKESAPLAWLTNKIRYAHQSPEELARHQRAREFGEFEPYARFILSPTLDCEPAEKALVHSFVGVLYSLEFTVPQVMATCERLEDQCNQLENTVGSLSDEVQRLERQALGAIDPQDPGSGTFPLRAFSDRSDLECFFRKKLFEIDLELFRIQTDRQTMAELDEGEREISLSTRSSGNGDITAPMLIKEVLYLIAQKQRKLRKLEKKRKALEVQLQEHESNWRVPLAKPIKLVAEICEARMILEHTRLQTAYALVKQSDVQAAIDSLKRTKEALSTGDLHQLRAPARSMTESQLLERKRCVGLEFARFSVFFQTKTDSSELPHERLRGLQRKAVAALRLLFITNLFRCCCCWMVENLIAAAKEEEPEVVEEEEDKKPLRVGLRAATPGKLVRGPTDKSARRRSSVTMTRTVLESLHRDSMLVDQAEQQILVMKQRYTDSATLIFNDERSAIFDKEQQKKVATELAIPMFAEINPITGALELPPKQLVDLDTLPVAADYSAREKAAAMAQAAAAAVPIRNRKKEQLLRAMFDDQQKRARNEPDFDEQADGESISQLPAIHSETFEFCNFKMSASALLTRAAEDTTLIGAPINDEVDNMDMIWKRVGRPEETTNKSNGNASSESDVFSSPDDEQAFHASLRLMSAHKDRKPLARMNSMYNRASINEAHMSVQTMEATRAVTAAASQSGATGDLTMHAAPLSVDSLRVSKKNAIEADPVAIDEMEEDGDTVLGDSEVERVMEASNPSSIGQGHEDSTLLGANTETDVAGEHSQSNGQDDDMPLDEALNSYLERIRIDSFLFQQPRGSAGNSDVESRRQRRTSTSLDPGMTTPEERRYSHIRWEADPCAPSLKPLPLVVESQPLGSLVAESTDSLAMDYQLHEAEHLVVMRQYVPRPQRKKGPLAEKDPQFSLLGASLNAKPKKKTTVAELLNVQSEPVLRRTDSENAGSRPNTRGDPAGGRTSRPSISVTIEHKKAEASYDLHDGDTSYALFRESSTCNDMILEVIGSRSYASVNKTKALDHGEPTLPAMSPSRRTFEDKPVMRAKPRQTQSCVDLHVAGATVQASVGSTNAQADEEIGSDGDLKGSLSKRQKESVWREFAGTPLSESVQNAYATLYPQTYQSTSRESDLPLNEAAAVHDPHHHAVFARARSKGNLSTQGQSVAHLAPQQSEIARDKQFWSAIEGYKAVGASILIAMDSQTKIARRKEKALAIYNEFLNDHSAQKLSWVDMYPNEVAAIRRNIHSGSKSLFNALQQTTQLHISTALALRDELGS